MKMKFWKRIVYLSIFVLLLIVEMSIGAFVRDDFIRPYIGDLLVIVLICCLFRVFVPKGVRFLGLYVAAFGTVVEFLQLLHLDKLLGFEGTVFSIALGSTFDLKDILCYLFGGILFFVIEGIAAKILKN